MIEFSSMKDVPTTSSRTGRLRSAGIVGQAMRAYYRDLHRSKMQRPVAWVSSVGPAEILIALGYALYFPENHAAMLGARRKAEDYTRYAHAEGYAPDICGYLRSDVGAYVAGESALSDIDAAITAPPKPDVLVYSTNQCRDIKEWFSWYARKLDAPCIGIESPTNVDAVTVDHIRAVARQMRGLLPTLEAIAKTRFDIDMLKETVRLSRECSNLWGRILDGGRSTPSPLSFRDALTLMGPAVIMRGTEDAVRLYEQVLVELEARRQNRIGAQKLERHRIYWDGMPIWGKLQALDRYARSAGIATVASTYCSSWVFDTLDADHPFDSMAEAYTSLFIVRSENEKMRYLSTMARRFGVDGILYHEAKTCPANSNTRYGLPDRLSRGLGMPYLAIYSDHMDTTLFDEERIATQLEAFAEQMEASPK